MENSLVLLQQDFKLFLQALWAELGLPSPTRAQYAIADYLQNGKKGRPRKLNLSEQDRLILEEAEKFFKKNPLPTFKPSRKITKKKRGDDTPPTAPVTRK